MTLPNRPNTPDLPGPLAHPNPGGARPADRIDGVLDALRTYWREHPDLRLGQIVSNIASEAGVETFFVEDAYTEAWLCHATP